MHYVETYNASEGYFGTQNDPNDPAMLLMIDYGVFYEFIPLEDVGKENPRICCLEEVELNKNYAMVISTSAGLWRYMIGDTVKFTNNRPYNSSLPAAQSISLMPLAKNLSWTMRKKV